MECQSFESGVSVALKKDKPMQRFFFTTNKMPRSGSFQPSIKGCHQFYVSLQMIISYFSAINLSFFFLFFFFIFWRFPECRNSVKFRAIKKKYELFFDFDPVGNNTF